MKWCLIEAKADPANKPREYGKYKNLMEARGAMLYNITNNKKETLFTDYLDCQAHDEKAQSIARTCFAEDPDIAMKAARQVLGMK